MKTFMKQFNVTVLALLTCGAFGLTQAYAGRGVFGGGGFGNPGGMPSMGQPSFAQPNRSFAPSPQARNFVAPQQNFGGGRDFSKSVIVPRMSSHMWTGPSVRPVLPSPVQPSLSDPAPGWNPSHQWTHRSGSFTPPVAATPQVVLRPAAPGLAFNNAVNNGGASFNAAVARGMQITAPAGPAVPFTGAATTHSAWNGSRDWHRDGAWNGGGHRDGDFDHRGRSFDRDHDGDFDGFRHRFRHHDFDDVRFRSFFFVSPVFGCNNWWCGAPCFSPVIVPSYCPQPSFSSCFDPWSGFTTFNTAPVIVTGAVGSPVVVDATPIAPVAPGPFWSDSGWLARVCIRLCF